MELQELTGEFNNIKEKRILVEIEETNRIETLSELEVSIITQIQELDNLKNIVLLS